MNPCEIALVTYLYQKDADGYETKTPAYLACIGYKKSVRQTEFYAAMKEGIKPAAVLEVYAAEYELATIGEQEPEEVLMEEVRYRIVRTYQTDVDRMELTLEKELHR